jgi:hypothetical protein
MTRTPEPPCHCLINYGENVNIPTIFTRIGSQRPFWRWNAFSHDNSKGGAEKNLYKSVGSLYHGAGSRLQQRVREGAALLFFYVW